MVPNAKAYIAALQLRTLRGGGQIVCDSSVERLTREGDATGSIRASRVDRVSGVVANVAGAEKEFWARVGVVAT